RLGVRHAHHRRKVDRARPIRTCPGHPPDRLPCSRRSLARAVAGLRSSVDRASGFYPAGQGFESSRGRPPPLPRLARLQRLARLVRGPPLVHASRAPTAPSLSAHMRQFSRPSHLCTLEVDPADPKRRTVDRESAYPEQLFTHLPASRVARRLCTLLPGLRCIFGPFLKRKSVPAVSPRSA